MANQFFGGALFMVCLTGLIQDYMGLDRYLEYAADHWIQLPWGLWIIPLVGVLIVNYRSIKNG